VITTLVPFGLLWVAGFWCLDHLLWLLPAVLALQVLFLARCFSLMHDCGHGSLFRSRRINRVVGFLFGVVAAIPQLPWSRGHAFHHRHNGDWQKYRGPSALISTEAFAALSPGRQRLYRWLRHPLMLFPGGFFYLVLKPRLELLLGGIGLIVDLITGLWRNPSLGLAAMLRQHRSRFWHSPEEAIDLFWNNVAVLSFWSLMGWQLGVGRFWSLYTPLMTGAAALFICVFFVQHNFADSYAHRTEGWEPMRGVLEGTSDLQLPPLLNWFTADIGCHSIHHLCEAIPNYRLRACREQNQDLLQSVTVLRLADIRSCFDYILWDPQAARLTTIAAELQRNG
jgi:omega-6 fatty acid desaturase (delta-12 desaturase)